MKQEEAWREFPVPLYAETAAAMAHFSVKSANSNAAAGGIRLDVGRGLRLPYCSVRTLLGAGQQVDIDYLKNVGSVATITKQMRMAMAGDPAVPPEQREAIRSAYETARSRNLEVGIEAVSPRLRQVLIPKPGVGTGYVALTPLSAAGTAVRIKQFVEDHNAAFSAKVGDARHRPAEWIHANRRIRTTSMGFGGSNPQNVGSLIRNLQTLVVVEAPRESPGLRAAFALFHRGPRLRLAHDLMQGFARWWMRPSGPEPCNAAERMEESRQVQGIALAALEMARRDCVPLERLKRSLPRRSTEEGMRSLFDDSVSPLLKGIVEPQWRRGDWSRQLAKRIVNAMESHRFHETELLRGNTRGDGPSWATISLSPEARGRIERHIEEVL